MARTGGARTGGVEAARPRRRDRKQTEAALFEAVSQLLARDGILAGLNLQEVAEAAGVNRGQIYQMYGNRHGLLRAALNKLVNDEVRANAPYRKGGFRARRQFVFRWTLKNRRWAEIAALLALDGDTNWSVMPVFTTTLGNLDRDRRDGELPPDVDGPAAHISTTAFHLGYTIFRDAFARDAGITPEELDERVFAVYVRMLNGIAGRTDPAGEVSSA